MKTNFNVSENLALFPKIKKLILHPKRALENLRLMEIEMSVYKEVFIEEPYLWLYERIKPNTTVLDIGACCGETAIYFARSPNAKRVVSYEPEDKLCEIAERNIKNSRYANKITLNKERLHDFTGIYDNFKSIAIKCDIEGGEKELFDKFILYNLQKKVYAIQIEFHSFEIGKKLNGIFEPYYRMIIEYDADYDGGYIYAELKAKR